MLFTDLRVQSLERIEFKIRLWQDQRFYDLGAALKLRGKEYDIELGLQQEYIISLFKYRDLGQSRTPYSILEALATRPFEELRSQQRALI